MDNKNFLPLGSVVTIKGSEWPYLIAQRCIDVEDDGEQKYFDYGAVDYPVGLQDDNQLSYFQHEQIGKVLFKGYTNEEDKKLVKIMNDSLGTSNKNFGLFS